jgi:hypothetical protein
MRNEMEDIKNVQRTARIVKIDNSLHFILCVVLEPDEIDLQGDIIGAEEIEKACHEYMANYRLVGYRHQYQIDAIVVENGICRNSCWINDQRIKEGSWIVGIIILDNNVWKQIENGEIKDVSIGGTGDRIKVESGIESNNGDSINAS